jgi:Uma2 family endonuclease
MTTGDYLYGTEETLHKRELHHGRLCREPAPTYGHQQIVLHIARLLCDHVIPRKLGQVAVAPVDVVLDAQAALIVQPDVLFISTERASIIREQVWGPPDLVVEVLSPRNQHFDRVNKVRWYHEHGVRECWLVDSMTASVWVCDFSKPTVEERLFQGMTPVRSTVLPDLETTAFGILLS